MLNTMTVRMEFKGKKGAVATVANGVPVWSVLRLGAAVKLCKTYTENAGSVSWVWRAGEQGILDAIQAKGEGGSVASVWFDAHGGVVEIPFEYLEPA